jgi:hypothetical protein
MADNRVMGPEGSYIPQQGSRAGATHVVGAQYKYISDEHVTSTDGTANFLTPPPGADFARIRVTGANIYWDLTRSTTPAAGVGDEANIGDPIFLYGLDDLTDFNAVRQASSNFTLKVFYYQEVAYDGAS